jgi:hypothetical protein
MLYPPELRGLNDLRPIFLGQATWSVCISDGRDDTPYPSSRLQPVLCVWSPAARSAPHSWASAFLRAPSRITQLEWRRGHSEVLIRRLLLYRLTSDLLVEGLAGLDVLPGYRGLHQCSLDGERENCA